MPIQIPDKTITKPQLYLHNGDDADEKWIAHHGIVYNVTDYPSWRGDLHRNLRYPSIDLSANSVKRLTPMIFRPARLKN